MKNRNWLIELRGAKPQADVANAVGITQQAYSAIEKGNRNPSVSLAKKIANELGFDWTKFFEDDLKKTG